MLGSSCAHMRSATLLCRLFLALGLFLGLGACREKTVNPTIVWISGEPLQKEGITGAPAADVQGVEVKKSDDESELDEGAEIATNDGMAGLPGSGESDIPFPRLNFAAQNAPLTSDLPKLSLPVAADVAYSHYAMKYGPSNDCMNQQGYAVFEASKSISIEQESLPMGPIYLCLIAYHFPSKRWQPLKDALVYNWQKIPLKRSIQTTFDALITVGCTNPTRVRFRARIDIDGTRGTYRWTLANPPGCNLDTGPGTNPLSDIKVVGDKMEGKFFDSGFEGWFKFQFKTPERNTFTGTWGFASAPLVTEGYWNSDL